MNWTTLFDMQQKLDQYIIDNHQLEDRDLFEEKCLALLVELGELANETRTFKFWSNKTPSDRTVILEEYVDNIHFLLSLGLNKNYRFHEIDFIGEKTDGTIAFNHAFSKCLTFYKDPSNENYLNMFKQYLQLATVLGFQEEEIIKAYHEKNSVNYNRQVNGY